MKQKVISIICTKNAVPGLNVVENKGAFEILNKEQLVKRIEELSDEDWGYTILIAEE